MRLGYADLSLPQELVTANRETQEAGSVGQHREQ